MSHFEDLRQAVQHNCHISDAQFAGQHTMCVFLLKMREYFRWEHGLPFGKALPRKSIGDWLVARERLWEQVEEQPFASLPVGDETLDPFDSDAINRLLIPEGMVYSGGYGQWCKPHFFLGRLELLQERHGYRVMVSGAELARDLVAPPAMSQGKNIYVRRESLRRMLWERVEEWHWQRRSKPSLPEATADYGFDDDPETALERMTDNELEATILHEVGEGMAGEVLGEDWRRMLSGLPRSRAELLARAVRDHLADSLSTLPALLEGENRASLHFYFANLKGMRRQLAPRLLEAYRQWRDSHRIEPLAAVVEASEGHWRGGAKAILERWRQDPESCAGSIAELEEALVY
jgi:hypothetical protein